MTDYTTATWADIDQMNHNHYGRGYPDIVLRTMADLSKAAEIHTETVDLWLAGKATKAECYEAFEVYRILSARVDRIYKRWMVGTLAINRLDLYREMLEEYDDPRADLQAVQ